MVSASRASLDRTARRGEGAPPWRADRSTMRQTERPTTVTSVVEIARFLRARTEVVIVRNMSDFRETTSDPPSSKKSRRALSEFQAIRQGDVVLQRHRTYPTKKNDFSNRRPKNSRPNLPTDMRLKIARASFDLRYPHQPFKAFRVTLVRCSRTYTDVGLNAIGEGGELLRFSRKNTRSRCALVANRCFVRGKRSFSRALSKFCNDVDRNRRNWTFVILSRGHIGPLFSPC